MVDLERAVRDHYKGIFRFALHLCRNQEDAADLTQFAYEQLASKHGEIRDPDKVKSWLCAVVYRKFLDQRRKIIRFPSVPIDEEADFHHTEQDSPGRKLDAMAALSALHELEDDLRAPISLFYLESISYKEIARILDVPVGTVMSRLYRAKAQLFTRLSGIRS